MAKIIATLHELRDAGPKQTAFIKRAVVRLQDALNHRDFEEKLLDAYYEESRWRSTEGRVEHVSADGVLTRVLAGRERATSVDHEIDLVIQLRKFKKKKTLGATVAGKLPISTAYWFINKSIDRDDIAGPAGHFIHEWMHVSGFFHYPDNSARNDPPYNIGNIVRSIIEDRFGEKGDPEIAKAIEEHECETAITEEELATLFDDLSSPELEVR